MSLPEPLKRSLSAEQCRALRLIAGNPYGCLMLAHGFKIEQLAVLVRDGLATAQPETLQAGSQPIEVVRVQITDAGRQALAGT